MHDKTQIMQQLKAWASEADRGSVVKTEPSQQQFDAPSYAIFDGCLFHLKKMAKSEQTVRLTNFVCEITDEITKLDDNKMILLKEIDELTKKYPKTYELILTKDKDQ